MSNAHQPLASCGSASGHAHVAGKRPGKVRRRGRLRALVLWVLGAVLAGLVTGVALHVLEPEWCRVAERTVPGAACSAERAVHRTRPATDEESLPSDADSADDGEKRTSSAAESSPEVAENTQSRRIGTLEVVDLGSGEATLAGALKQQHELARKRGQTLMVMLTGRRCRPCRGVDSSLSDPLMQVALDSVRLVRVDLDAFREEIDVLGLPRDIYPAFFLLGPDGSPRDTIHGGEWGADVAENIAPVLGAFVRGNYHARRYQRAPSSRAVRL